MATRHAFTVEEWHLMGAAGLFDEDSRVELIDGEVMEMSPIGPRHALCVNRLNHLLVVRVADRAIVQIQSPIALNERSEPQPDVALLRPPVHRYAERLPGPGDVYLLIEVGDSSLAFDRDVKAPRYGAAGVPETWVVDLHAGTILVLRNPGPDGYRDTELVGRGSAIEVATLPPLTVSVSDIID